MHDVAAEVSPFAIRPIRGPVGRAQCAVAAATAARASGGALNVYAYGRDVFDQHAVDLGELFAKPAAVAVHNAQTLADALARTAKLRSALSIRTVIDQAIGVILVTTGGSAEDALTQLQAMSQAEHRTLADVAQHVIDDAVRRARDRPQSS